MPQDSCQHLPEVQHAKTGRLPRADTAERPQNSGRLPRDWAGNGYYARCRCQHKQGNLFAKHPQPDLQVARFESHPIQRPDVKQKKHKRQRDQHRFRHQSKRKNRGYCQVSTEARFAGIADVSMHGQHPE
jgi:hypothetical protein